MKEDKYEDKIPSQGILKKKIEVSPIFYVTEPSQTVHYSADGSGSTGFDLEKHLRDGKGWKFNSLGQNQGAVFKKILFSAALVLSGKTKWVIPGPLQNSLLKIGIKEIYGLDDKTGNPIAYNLSDFKNSGDYFVLETKTIHSTEPEAAILHRLSESENLNNWFIIDSYHFFCMQCGGQKI